MFQGLLKKSGLKPIFTTPPSWSVEIRKCKRVQSMFGAVGAVTSAALYYVLLESHAFSSDYIRTAQGLVCLPAMLFGLPLLLLWRRYNKELDRLVEGAFPGIPKNPRIRTIAAKFHLDHQPSKVVSRHFRYHCVFSVMVGYILAFQLLCTFGPRPVSLGTEPTASVSTTTTPVGR